MALYAGARYRSPLRGIMVLSGYEVLAETREAEPARPTRRRRCSSATARTIRWSRSSGGARPIAGLRTPEREAQWHEFPMAHEVSPAEIAVIRDWLGGLFAAVRS